MKSKKFVSAAPSAEGSLFTHLPSMDSTMYLDNGTAIQIRTRPAFLYMRFLVGGVMSFAVLGHSTIEKAHVLMSRDLAKKIIERITSMKSLKLKAPVARIPAIVVSCLRLALKSGTAEMMIPSVMFGYPGLSDDAAISMMSASIQGVLGDRDLRIRIDISDDVVLDVMPVSWPKPSKRTVPKDAN